MNASIKLVTIFCLFLVSFSQVNAQTTYRLEMNRVVVDQARETDGDRPYFVSIHFRVAVNQRGSTVSTVIEQEPHDWVSKPEYNRGTKRGRDGKHMIAYDQLEIPFWMGSMEWRNFDMLTIEQIVDDPSKVNEIELFGTLILALDNNNTPPHFVRDLMNKFNLRFSDFLRQKVERDGFATALELATNGTAAVNALRSDLLGLTQGLFGVSDAIDWVLGSTFNPDAIVGANLLIFPNITGFTQITSSGESRYLGKWNALIQTPQDYTGRMDFEGAGAKYHVNYSFRGETCGNATHNRYIRNLTFAIKTGQDDLRGGGNAEARIILKDGRTFSGTLNHGRELKKNSIHFADIRLTNNVKEQDIATVEITYTSGSCFGCTTDNWDLNSLKLLNAHYPVLTVHGFPVKRFTGNSRTLTLEVYSGCRQMLFLTPGAIQINTPIQINQQNKVNTPKIEKQVDPKVVNPKYQDRGIKYYPKKKIDN
ncbi:MAG: hypothetical protein AAF502_14770 [Bacteroidota bacterium]